ncbi:hypothetical protein T02_10139 [Trichinella nativa]|uniref:Uncharacterized protein n=1 Tax=Trichinella nativa TaxID=6335 RepID=A0A0V1LEV9_9BILA|nr:hypothetical protein T02_10139 [Trichinella nativa]
MAAANAEQLCDQSYRRCFSSSSSSTLSSSSLSSSSSTLSDVLHFQYVHVLFNHFHYMLHM